MSLIEFTGECANCEKKTTQAFQVKHPDTAMHWRCATCLRSLLDDGKAVMIVGYVTKTKGIKTEDPFRVYKEMRAAEDEALSAPSILVKENSVSDPKQDTDWLAGGLEPDEEPTKS